MMDRIMDFIMLKVVLPFCALLMVLCVIYLIIMGGYFLVGKIIQAAHSEARCGQYTLKDQPHE